MIVRLTGLLFILFISYQVKCENKFTNDFSFGVASAAYQVEGGWNADDKGENIWDHLLHKDPGFSYQNANGDVASDTYHLAVKDVDILKNLGVQHYRFSIAWTRILPNGTNDYVSKAGIKYYDDLINALIKANIKPMVTLYHWDLPQKLQDKSGFLNPLMLKWFEDYARVCFKNFGDRVKTWLTFNEPGSTCLGGYEDGSSPPLEKHKGTGKYHCAHTILLSHATAYRMYEKDFKPTQKGKVSIVIPTSWYQGITNSEEDKNAAERNLIFAYGHWMFPLIFGDYPDLMKTVIAQNSKEEGLKTSRLPVFSDAEKKQLKGALDFVALNHYTTYQCKPGGPWGHKTSSYYRDVAVDCSQPSDWKPGSGWLRVTPWGMKNILMYIKDKFSNPEVVITENGYSDHGGLKDDNRTYYHRSYLQKVLEAINEGCNVKGYTVWSFLDDFEWGAGYLAKFGLIQVNFNKPERTRTRKYSSFIYENIIKTKKIDWAFSPKWPQQIT